MQSRSRRARAYFHYLRGPLRNFLPLLAGLAGLLVIGSICFHQLYRGKTLSWSESLLTTYFLLFGQPADGYDQHWALQLFEIAMPLLGLVVILDGIVRFSYHILRRDEAGAEWIHAMGRTLNNHVVLCGLGKLGLRTLEQLLALGEQVAVLEKNPSCPNIAFARKHGVPVRVGHSREEGVFDDLNVRAAKSIILATNDDLANLEMALDARKLKPDIRVVIRMFDQELADKLRDSLDMKLTFSASALAAPLFATSSSDRSVVNSFYVGDRLLVLAKLTINAGSKLAGKAIREIGKGEHAFVLSHARNGEPTLFPTADAMLEIGDEITVQTEPPALHRLHELNRDPRPY
jgi:Trk K+ transport system NAD-binding subunit